jgi:ATP-dependent Clp protease ATP-binding subunit ClpA
MEAGKGGSSRGALERTFTPEFRNRLDATVTFSALGTPEIERVVDKQIDELRAMVAAKQVTIDVTPEARAWLAEKGFDRAFGARPMARLIEQSVKKPLSESLLFGSLAEGGTVTLVVRDGELALDEVPGLGPQGSGLGQSRDEGPEIRTQGSGLDQGSVEKSDHGVRPDGR